MKVCALSLNTQGKLSLDLRRYSFHDRTTIFLLKICIQSFFPTTRTTYFQHKASIEYATALTFYQNPSIEASFCRTITESLLSALTNPPVIANNCAPYSLTVWYGHFCLMSGSPNRVFHSIPFHWTWKSSSLLTSQPPRLVHLKRCWVRKSDC